MVIKCKLENIIERAKRDTNEIIKSLTPVKITAAIFVAVFSAYLGHYIQKAIEKTPTNPKDTSKQDNFGPFAWFLHSAIINLEGVTIEDGLTVYRGANLSSE